MQSIGQHLRRARIYIGIVILGLVLSGLTAFALETEVRWMVNHLPDAQAVQPSAFTAWILKVQQGLRETNQKFPFIAYGTDWLAFAHLVIAAAFIGPWRDPRRNIWVIDFGLIACAGIVPLAFIAGGIRGIPWGWQLIDCSFGVFGAIPLLLARLHITQAQRLDHS